MTARRWAVAVAATACSCALAAGAAPAAFAAPGSLGSSGSLSGSDSLGSAAPDDGTECGEVTATPSDMRGWGAFIWGEQTATIVGNVDGSTGGGAVRFPGDGTHVSFFHRAGTPLADVADFAYRYKGTAPAVQLRITGASTPGSIINNPTRFATLVVTPQGSSDSNGDGWYTVTAHDLQSSDQWWATRDIDGFGPRGTTGTLEQLITANPDARLDHYGLASTADMTGETLLDSFTYGCTTTVFSADGGGGSGSLGSLIPSGSLGSLIPSGSLGSLIPSGSLGS